MRCHSVVAGIVLSAFGCSDTWAQATGSLVVTLIVPATASVGVPTTVSTPITNPISAGGFVAVATLSVPDAAADLSGPRVFSGVTDPTGTVSLSALPFGVYSVCVEPQDGIHVSPCSSIVVAATKPDSSDETVTGSADTNSRNFTFLISSRATVCL